MKLERLTPEPGALASFFDDSLVAMGAVVERTWYDQLHVLAEGDAARVWNASGDLHEADLRFPAPDAQGPRDASIDVFPGCPATFRLAELLNPRPVAVRRAVLAAEPASLRAPTDEVAGRTWSQCFPSSPAFSRASAFLPTFHFRLAAVVRSEIQAIDQSWSVHRVQASLADGSPIGRAEAEAVQAFDPAPPPDVPWSPLDPARVQALLADALAIDMAPEIAAVRARQQRHLARELRRIDEYFASYEQELRARRPRRGTDPEAARNNLAARVAAAHAEHQRRRDDQRHRHAIRVTPHLDAVLVLAERAWETTVSIPSGRDRASRRAIYVPHARRWHLVPET